MNSTKTAAFESFKTPLARQLAKYAAAASAVSWIATEVSAGVVYDDFDDVVLQGDLGSSVVASIDIDDNGVIDFEFGQQPVTSSIGTAIAIPCEGFTNPSVTPNRIAMKTVHGGFYIQNIAEGATIDDSLPNLGPGGTQTFGYLAYGAVADCIECEFNDTTGFVGLSFEVDGQTNYGWIRVRVDEGGNNRLTLLDSAYNDMGQPISAGQVPEPGGLGLLAVGGVGLMALRRRRKQNAN